MRVFKRIYVSDVMALLDVANTGYAVTSRDVASRHGRSQSWASKHLRKLVKIGYLNQYGRTRCCHQRYKLQAYGTHEIATTRVLEELLDFFSRNPHREYVLLEFVIATVRCSYATSGFSKRERWLARPYGASIGYGTIACGSLVDLPVFTDFWIPLEWRERVFLDLETSGVEWHLEDYVPHLC